MLNRFVIVKIDMIHSFLVRMERRLSDNVRNQKNNFREIFVKIM